MNILHARSRPQGDRLQKNAAAPEDHNYVSTIIPTSIFTHLQVQVLSRLILGYQTAFCHQCLQRGFRDPSTFLSPVNEFSLVICIPPGETTMLVTLPEKSISVVPAGFIPPLSLHRSTQTP
jgi:hypothetical protein